MTENSRKIELIAVGLNPAWQKILTFPKLELHGVNRAEKVVFAAAGKGINFAIAAKNWGVETTVFQFHGGRTGKQLVKYLDDHKIHYASGKIPDDTRFCTTCLCSSTGEMTELIEPSPKIPQRVVTYLKVHLEMDIPKYDGIALCGTFPPGVGAEFYAGAAKAAAKHNKPVLLDACKDIGGTLPNTTILKVNRAELLKLTGKNELNSAAKQCLDNYPLKAVAVTSGPGRAYLSGRGNSWELLLPEISGVVNPLGAGDTTSAVLLAEFTAGKPLPEAFASALAAASASCRYPECARFTRKEAETIRKEIKIRELK